MGVLQNVKNPLLCPPDTLKAEVTLEVAFEEATAQVIHKGKRCIGMYAFARVLRSQR